MSKKYFYRSGGRGAKSLLALGVLSAVFLFTGCQPDAGPAAPANAVTQISAGLTGDKASTGLAAAHPAQGIRTELTDLAWVQQTKLLADDMTPGTSFGRAVSVSGDTAVVGAWYASAGGFAQAGYAYVFVRSGNVWTQQAKLSASDPATNGYFGYAVAISGDTVLVGAYGAAAAAGKVYVFTRSGTSWTEQAKLTASDTATNAQFGAAVAISGDTAVIGATGAAPAALVNAGQAYVFTRSGTTWTEQAKLAASDKKASANFGNAVALDGNTAVVGALATASYAGEAYVFVSSGASWTEQAKLIASDRSSGAEFGISVALSGDTAVVGASEWGSSTGKVYVYVRSGTSWTEQTTLLASDSASGANFGSAVALVGDTAVVGAYGVRSPSYDEGAAYVFGRSGTTWTQQTQLTASDKAAQAYFGMSAALSGNTLIVGASPGYCSGLCPLTSAYAFRLLKNNGDMCTTDQECVSNTCAGGTCGKQSGTACAGAAECKSAFCVDGVCCKTACAGGTADCQACSTAAGATADGTCGPRAAATVCASASTSTCVAGGTCDGSAITCKLAPAANTVVCSTSADSATCRANYRCDGTTLGSCPVTNPTPAASSTVCNSTADATHCAASFRCDGVKAGSCPTTNPTPASSATVCSTLGDATQCAANYRCDGVKAGSCPTTNPTPASSATVCNATGDATRCAETYRCDGVKAGSCPTTNPTPASSSTVCSTTGDASRCIKALQCDGVKAGSCPVTNPAPAAATVMCRAAMSTCDAAEFCTGSQAACPADGPGPDNTSCSAGSCQLGQCRAESDLSLQFVAASQTSMQKPVPVQLQVKNTGKSAAADVTLTLTLPTAVGFSASQIMGAGWTCQTQSAPFTCSKSQVAKGEVTGITMMVVPPLHQEEFTIVGQLISSTFDTNLINNSAQLTISNVAPCATACPSSDPVGFDAGKSNPPDGGAPDGGPQAGGCQMSGPAALPAQGWLALLGACLILRRRSRRPSRQG